MYLPKRRDVTALRSRQGPIAMSRHVILCLLPTI